MTGYLVVSEERGRGSACVKQLCGLPILEVKICVPKDIRPHVLKRKLNRAVQILRRAEVLRVIFPPSFPYREYFGDFKAVEPLEFYRSAADVLILGWLEHHGVDRTRGRVALSGSRLSPDLEYTARRLCPAVRGVRIDVPGEEEAWFAAELQRVYGVPVVPRGMPVDLIAEFSPMGTGQLRLWGEEPYLDGLRLTAEGVEPPAEIADAVLTLLWEQGKIRRDQLRVICDKKKEEN